MDLGATTFWEHFDLDWTKNAVPIDQPLPADKKDIHGDFGDYSFTGFRRSLCHGWASGPTAWLTEHVLGIKIAAPGCAVIKISPNLADLEWAEGTFPTPKGIVKVKHIRQANGEIESSIEAPEGIRILREE